MKSRITIPHTAPKPGILSTKWRLVKYDYVSDKSIFLYTEFVHPSDRRARFTFWHRQYSTYLINWLESYSVSNERDRESTRFPIRTSANSCPAYGGGGGTRMFLVIDCYIILIIGASVLPACIRPAEFSPFPIAPVCEQEIRYTSLTTDAVLRNKDRKNRRKEVNNI